MSGRGSQSQALVIVLAASLGLLLGIGAFTFYYAEGFSYASKDPKVCANCHVMNHQYASWGASGHHHVASCNDCHLPAGGISKLWAKARNGWNHSIAFTFENYHEPIQIKPFNVQILQKNCVRCHQALVADGPAQAQSCIHCHRNVGHYPIH